MQILPRISISLGRLKKNESYSDIAGHTGGTLFPKFVFLAAAAAVFIFRPRVAPIFSALPAPPSLPSNLPHTRLPRQD